MEIVGHLKKQLDDNGNAIATDGGSEHPCLF